MRGRSPLSLVRLAGAVGLLVSCLCVAAPAAASRLLIRVLHADVSLWWTSAAFGPWAIRRIGIIGAGVLLGTAILALGWQASRRPSRSLRGLHASDSGTAMLEFTLVLPFALMIFLIVLQTALIYEANFHVSLAAFRGARSAMVWSPPYYTPTDLPLYPPPVPPETIDRAWKAAAWTCLPIAGVYPCAATLGDQASLDEQTWRDYLGSDQPWMGNWFIAQYRYARAHTRVFLFYDTPTGSTPLSTPEMQQQWRNFWVNREPINVRVEHDYQLRVPYAARIMKDKKLADGLYITELKAYHLLLNDVHRELLNGEIPPSPLP